jgi:microsomal dipeptidase-like Zn-dependent dipeptidase
MNKYLTFAIGIVLFQYTSLVQAQDIETFIDIHVNTTKKPFNSRSNGQQIGIWEPFDHECGYNLSSQVMSNLGNNVPKHSQSHLEALVKGNTRIACLNLSPIEQKLINTNNQLTDKNKQSTVACVAGIDANQLFLRRKEIDYFKDLVENINYVQRYEKKGHYVNGFEYGLELIKNKKHLEDIAADPNRLGLILTVEGGHSLGHSIYIDNDITKLEEYRKFVLQNVDRLKGTLPLSDIQGEYLDVPVLWISLAKTFKNGLGGFSNSLNKAEQNIFDKPEGMNTKETKLGIEVIERLISKDNGRRILIDIKHMSLDFRTRYYKTVERSEILGDAIPIVCSHCAISGMPKRQNIYRKKDDDSKNNNYYLNHWKQNLSKEDIQKIHRSRGLIGIPLDKTVLGGQLALSDIENQLSNTVQLRKACIKLLMANILTVVSTINDPSAWDIISIGSDFDEMRYPLDVYQSSEDLPQLAVDIQRFLERPENIQDLFNEEQIRNLLFDLTPAEITAKIMSENAYEFIKKNIDNVSNPKLEEEASSTDN